MGEIFEAIGFEVGDEASFNTLAECAESNGERTVIYRGDATLHGRCWKLGEGLEVWSVLHENAKELYYADCRPSFRSRYVHTIEPWELAEYDGDGEAIVRGSTTGGASVVFELQNLTEVSQRVFRDNRLRVGLAGLAASVRADAGPDRIAGFGSGVQGFQPASAYPELAENACENDYIVNGYALAWRILKNPVTSSELIWMYLDAKMIRLEVLANRRALRGRLKTGAMVSANIWLQGHILEETEITARYEGVDQDSMKSDFWSMLRRGN
jgi:hypothetical protein